MPWDFVWLEKTTCNNLKVSTWSLTRMESVHTSGPTMPPAPPLVVPCLTDIQKKKVIFPTSFWQSHIAMETPKSNSIGNTSSKGPNVPLLCEFTKVYVMDNKRLLLPQLPQFQELMTWRVIAMVVGTNSSQRIRCLLLLKEHFIKNLIYTKEKCLGFCMILLHI